DGGARGTNRHPRTIRRSDATWWFRPTWRRARSGVSRYGRRPVPRAGRGRRGGRVRAGQRRPEVLEVGGIHQPVSPAFGDEQQPHRLRAEPPGRLEAVEVGGD